MKLIHKNKKGSVGLKVMRVADVLRSVSPSTLNSRAVHRLVYGPKLAECECVLHMFTMCVQWVRNDQIPRK